MTIVTLEAPFLFLSSLLQLWLSLHHFTGHHKGEALDFVSETTRTVEVNDVHVIMFLFKYALFKPTATVSEITIISTNTLFTDASLPWDDGPKWSAYSVWVENRRVWRQANVVTEWQRQMCDKQNVTHAPWKRWDTLGGFVVEEPLLHPGRSAFLGRRMWSWSSLGHDHVMTPWLHWIHLDVHFYLDFSNWITAWLLLISSTGAASIAAFVPSWQSCAKHFDSKLSSSRIHVIPDAFKDDASTTHLPKRLFNIEM